MRRMSFEQRRSELIAAAARVIARDGLDATSSRAIVAEADMPLGALHYVFDSREDLLRALIAEVAEAERTTILSVLDGCSGSGIEDMMRAALHTYVRLMRQNPDRELAVAELSLHGVRHNPERAKQQWETYFAQATESLERGADMCGAVWTRPVEQIAHSLVSCMDGLTLTWLITRDEDAISQHIDFLAHSFAVLSVPADSVVAVSKGD